MIHHSFQNPQLFREGKMPKHKAGHLSNFRGHAEMNTNRTRVRKAQEEEMENVQVSLDDSDVFPSSNIVFSLPMSF